MDNSLYDAQAESTWISTGIYHPEFLRIDSNIRPEFFYDKVNKCLTWAIQNLAIKKGVDNIDEINLESILATDPVKKQIVDSGLGDMTAFINMAKLAARPTYEEFKLSEDVVITNAFKRDILNYTEQLAKIIKDPKSTIESIDAFCNDELQKILDKYVFGADSCEIGQRLDEIWGEIVRKRTETGYGLPFCLDRLNEFVSLVPGEMTVMIGETGKGKSSFFLVQSLYTAIKSDTGVLLIDSELTDDVWTPRALASLSNVPVWKIKTGKMNAEEEDRFTKAYKQLKELHIVHEYLPTFDRMKVEQLCRKWVNRGFGLIVLDYLKPSPGHYDAASISQDLGLQADYMKQLSGTLDVPVLAGMQQNEETKEAADSKKVRRYVDTQLYWEEKDEDDVLAHPECGSYRIRVGKNRNGASTTKKNYIDVNFEKDVMRISGAKMHTVEGGDTPFD